MEISASSQKPVELLAGTLLVLSYMIIFPFRALDVFWARADLDQTHRQIERQIMDDRCWKVGWIDGGIDGWINR